MSKEKRASMTKRLHVLFVCSGNVDRSPTAEEMFRGKDRIETRSAGTFPGVRTRVSKELIDWADIIFAMEEVHKESITRIDPTAREKTIVLDIPDAYPRNDPELQKILKKKVSSILGCDP